jgi:hypothetical protein
MLSVARLVSNGVVDRRHTVLGKALGKSVNIGTYPQFSTGNEILVILCTSFTVRVGRDADIRGEITVWEYTATFSGYHRVCLTRFSITDLLPDLSTMRRDYVHPFITKVLRRQLIKAVWVTFGPLRHLD